MSAWALGYLGVSWILVAMILTAATLEAVTALCLGCKVFGLLIRLGLIPEAGCVDCADLSLRRPEPGEVPAGRRP